MLDVLEDILDPVAVRVGGVPPEGQLVGAVLKVTAREVEPVPSALLTSDRLVTVPGDLRRAVVTVSGHQDIGPAILVEILPMNQDRFDFQGRAFSDDDKELISSGDSVKSAVGCSLNTD